MYDPKTVPPLFLSAWTFPPPPSPPRNTQTATPLPPLHPPPPLPPFTLLDSSNFCSPTGATLDTPSPHRDNAIAPPLLVVVPPPPGPLPYSFHSTSKSVGSYLYHPTPVRLLTPPLHSLKPPTTRRAHPWDATVLLHNHFPSLLGFSSSPLSFAPGPFFRVNQTLISVPPLRPLRKQRHPLKFNCRNNHFDLLPSTASLPSFLPLHTSSTILTIFYQTATF